VKKHGIGSLPGRRFPNGETAEPQRIGAGGAGAEGGSSSDGLARKHREDVSYSWHDTLDAWEQWLIATGQSYLPLVGGAGGPTTLEQLEKRARMRHVLSFMLPMHVELLYAVHVEGRTQSDVAEEFCITQQAVSKRLAVAEQDFRREFGNHWNDDIDIDLSVEEGAI